MFVFAEQFCTPLAKRYINTHTLCSGATEVQVAEVLKATRDFTNAQKACVFLGKFVYEYSDVDEFSNVEEAITEVWNNCFRRMIVDM